VQDQGIIAHPGVEQGFLDRFEAVQIQVLRAFEFVGAVGIADGHGQRIHARLPHEIHRFVRVGVGAALGIAAAFLAVVVLRAHQHAQLAFHHAVVRVGVFDDAAADLDVPGERLVAAVNHHAGKALVNALLAKLEGVAVIQVNGEGDVAGGNGGFDQLFEINGLAYCRAPLEIWRMKGAFSSSQASTMAWSSSILFALKAPRAYFPLRALAKRSLVCVNGIIQCGARGFAPAAKDYGEGGRKCKEMELRI
jgi:hypothetical protein